MIYISLIMITARYYDIPKFDQDRSKIPDTMIQNKEK